MIFSDFPFSSIFNKPAIWGSFIFRNPKKPTDIHRDEIPAKPRVLSKSSTCTDFNTWPLLGGVIYPAWWTYKKRTGSHGPNRNRWFTVLKNGGSFHGYVSHNQRVIWFNIWVIYKVERLNYVTSSCLGWFGMISHCQLRLPDRQSHEIFKSLRFVCWWRSPYWCLAGNRWEWGNGMIITSYCGSFPHSLVSTSKFVGEDHISWWDPHRCSKFPTAPTRKERSSRFPASIECRRAKQEMSLATNTKK